MLRKWAFYYTQRQYSKQGMRVVASQVLGLSSDERRV